DRPARRLGEVRGRFDAGQLRRLDQRVEERRDARPAFRAGPVMVLATDDDRTQSALDRVRIERDAGVVEKPLQPFPVPECVLDGLAERRARQHRLRQEPSNELDALPEAGQVGGAARVELQGQALAKLRTAALLVAPVVWGAWLGQSLGHALVAASPDMSSRESTPKCSSRVREIRLPGSWRGRRVSVLWA